MPRLLDLSVRGLLDEIAAEAPTPGGGSLAALTGACAAGLLEMAARNSPDWELRGAVIAQAQTLRERLTELAPLNDEVYEQARHARNSLSVRASGERQSPPDGLDRGDVGLDALFRERRLEVGDQELAEACVDLGARHDPVEVGPGRRQLLRRLHPAPRGGWQEPKQCDQTLFRMRIHRPPDGRGWVFLPRIAP